MENTGEEEQQEGSAENEEGSEAGWSDCEDRGNDQGDETESLSGESENGDGSGISSDDSDGGSEKCAICLQKFLGQEIGTPETCEHHFCLKCITEWSKKVATCPVDRKVFPAILVKEEIFGTVQRIVDVEVGNAGEETLFDDYDTDPTYCEICGHCDREDRLLLCDGCDLGYHLECLEPPMEFVPIEDWYCPTCQTQREAQTEDVVQRPSRREIRLPRTGQSRRILESIRQTAWRETSSVTTTSGSSSTTIRKRRTYRKTGVRRTKGKKRGTGRRSKRRSRKGKQKRSRVVIERRPSTAKGRLAAQLGILPPRPGQVYVGLPRCRAPVSQAAQSSNSSILRNLRYQAGITPLRIYGTEDLADCVESFSDEEGSVGVARPQSIHRIGIPVKPSFPYPGTTRYVEIPQQSSNPDILGPILNNQIIMLTDRNIQIKRDGTLIPSISISPSASPVKPTRRNSITNENSRRGYDPVVKSLDLKLNSVIKNVPPSSQPSLSMTNVTVRQAPTSPNSNDSTNGSTASISNSNNNNGSSQGMSVGHEGRNSLNADNAVNSWNSNSRGGAFCGQNSSQPSDDPNGARAYENFLQSSNNNSPKQNPDRKKSVENEPESKCDDDEEYNIYSDIEEDDTPRQPDNEVETEPIIMKEKDRDSDDDMVIDEDGVGMIKMGERESRSSVESSSRHDGKESRQDPDIVAMSSGIGLKPEEIPSPTSIPLPDSPPPPTSEVINSSEDDDDDEEVLTVRNKRQNFSSPSANSVRADPPFRNSHVKKAREEYDPSQPLNSSEEEEEEEDLEIQLPPLSPNRPKLSPRYQANVQSSSSGSSSSLQPARVDETDLDLNSIPMPSDDYKRPTIQFSIPTRHKLLSISSLIKRQKGVAKKETKNALSFTSEISKAFGEDKQDDSDDEQNRGDDEPKLSLVAEIFGSDDEDDRPKKDENPLVADVPSLMVPSQAAVAQTQEVILPLPLQQSLELEDQLGSVGLAESANPIENTPRWKKIVVETEDSNKLVEPEENDFPLEKDVQEATANNIIINEDESSNDSISVLEMIENPKYVDDEVQVVSVTTVTSGGDMERRSKDFGRKSQINDRDKPIVLESISEGDSEFERDSSKGGSGSGSKRKPKKDKDIISRDKGREKDSRKVSKRKRSFSSVSNREEGEIIDSPEKRRKKKKEKKKSKKRRRSKDDKSTRLDFSEKKLSDVPPPLHNSSEEENLGDNLIAWRKPSNSAKERNYRDGKPKPEEKYFKPRDKKRDSSPRDRREKVTREKSPPISKDKSFKERNDSGRSRRRSASPRSKSRSFSRSKNNRRPRSRSCRTSSTKSFHSRSRSRSLRRSHKRRFSLSPRRSRSGSRSPLRLRSRSALRRSRNRKRSLSNNRTRRFKGRKRSGSSSGTSVSSKRSKRKRRDKVINNSGEKLKRRRDKEKEKIPEPRDVEDKEREKDKEKKKRKRRREKSVSPAKEIFADGDSIVVSLNFQKGGNASFGSSASKDGGYTPPLRNTPDSEKNKVGRGRSRRGRSDEKDENGKPRLLKKTLLIDLETSPIQEQNIGVSPTLIVLSDDEEAEDKHKGLEESTKDTRDGVAVTTSSTDGLNEGGSPYRHGVAADSTQIHHPNQSDSKLDDSSFSVSMCTSISPYEGSNLSPTRGDSLVTSTRDSEMGLVHEDDSRSPSPLSPSLKSSDNKMMMHQPRSPVGSPPPPLPPGSPPEHLLHDSRNENAGTPTSSVSSHMSNHQTSLPSAPGKPLIGNIPGLFPSSGVSASSSVNIPPPIVIPTPPNSQMRFPPAVNQNILPQNVLASVATALYAPILAARQQQQSNLSGKFSAPSGGGMTVSGNKTGQQGSSVLLPKNQNSHSHGSSGGIRSSRGNSSGLLTGEGDSPFSPNSSEGDDLFEPPLERSQMDSVVGSKSDKAAGGQASNNSQPSSGAAGGGNLGNSGGKQRDKNSLFDNLFGGAPSKKTQIHHKSHDKPVKSKSAPHHKSKSKRVAKKEIPKLSEGELRLTEDVPTSAVELRVKEKFLKKLNRQERVVEEVKLSLKPHYSKKHVTKDEYKEILRRAVPKICHNKSGEINPFKIKELVEAYVKKFRHSRKKDVSSS